jgi:hypothetical protein
MTNELERMWKEAVVALYKALSHNLLGRIEENHGNLSQDSWFPRFEPETCHLTVTFGS